MINLNISGIVCLLFFLNCTPAGQRTETRIPEQHEQEIAMLNPSGKTIETRFNCPAGFKRVMALKGSFGEYLRQLPLKSDGSPVMTYNGRVKSPGNVHEAVVDLPIGNKDLHQCADAVMRLRAEYLFSCGKLDSIHFNFTNGFRVDYNEWRKGKRVRVQGNKTSWVQTTSPSETQKSFWEYLETIFSYAGTLSLSRELKPVRPVDLKAGDVFIQGGSPGHAVIVVDVAVNPETGEKIFMLAQSYMPAQEIHILKNRNSRELSPWYVLENDEYLSTPEWQFRMDMLKKF